MICVFGVRMVLNLFTILSFCILSDASPATPQAFNNHPQLKILGKYCLECHDEATAKGRFSLESLPWTFSNGDPAKRWTLVHDRLQAGSMPPADKPQPSASEREEVVRYLDTELSREGRAFQQREGRVRVRRLNRFEFENTLSDMLGVPVDVARELPEDVVMSGFDNLSLGLDLSAEHWIRYQNAVRHALDGALPDGSLKPQKIRFTGRDWYQKTLSRDRDTAALILGDGARLEGDRVWIYAQSVFHEGLDIPAGTPYLPGKYRIRAQVRARTPDSAPIGILFQLSGYPPEADPTLIRMLGVKEVSGSSPSILEFDFDVPANSERWNGRSVTLKAWSLRPQSSIDALKANRLVNEKIDWSGPALGVDWVEWEGPVALGPQEGLKRLFGSWNPHPKKDSEVPSRADIEAQIAGFGSRAFRHPLDAALLESFMSVYQRHRGQGEEFFEAMKSTYLAMLSSPYFLFRWEDPGPLDDAALASRLSYFLWSSAPDERLLDRALKGTLKNPEILDQELDRMLEDPRIDRFVSSFTGQWLELRKLNATSPDVSYGEFDDALLFFMPQETQLFFREMLRPGHSILEFVKSDWTFLNSRLARHYAIPDPRNWEMRKQPLPQGSHRGGVLTHAAILKLTANGTSTSPVMRGKWILDKILGTPPAPPPPSVKVIEPDIRGAHTLRELLLAHQKDPGCASCHRFIDPPGFALENFDVIGGWRDWYRVRSLDGKRMRLPNYPQFYVSRGAAVDASGVTAEGKRFQSIDEYRDLLVADSRTILRSLITKLVVYATGAELQYPDRAEIERLMTEVEGHQLEFRSLIRSIVHSRLFLEK